MHQQERRQPKAWHKAMVLPFYCYETGEAISCSTSALFLTDNPSLQRACSL